MQSTISARGWVDYRARYGLLVRKFHSSHPTQFSTAGLDAILGDCMMVTDVPGVKFAGELLDAYAGVKVVSS